MAASAAKASSNSRRSGTSNAATSGTRTASTPRERIGASSGRYSQGLLGSVPVAAPAGAAWSNAHCAAAMSSTLSTGARSALPGSATGQRSRPAPSGSRIAARASKLRARKRRVISNTCSVCNATDSARANS